MSSLVFPSMAGLDIAIKRMPVYATKIQTASSGKELRASFQSTPRFRYSLPLNFLRQAVLNMDADEAAQLLAFFDTHKGRWDSFWLPDAMAVNLIPNGTSEDPNPTGIAALGVVAYGQAFGTRARLLLGSGGYTNLDISDYAPCAPGDKFFLQAWGWRPALGAGNGRVYIAFCDSTKTAIGGNPFIEATSSTYTKYQLFATAPANTAYVFIRIENDLVPNAAEIYWDNLFFCRASAAGLAASPDGSLARVADTNDFQRKVRFDTDELEFDRFLAQVWEAKSLPFISVK